MKQTIYFIPGLGASSKIFERIHLDANLYEMKLLDWLDPIKNESLEDYVQRLLPLIENNKPILVGVSFGGIIAQEIAKRIDYEKLVIISSIKSIEEYSPRLKWFKKFKAYKVFPSRSINFLLNCGKVLPKKSFFGKKIKMYNVYLVKRKPYYLDWSMRMALNWKNPSPLPNTIHIQGTNDHIFPLRYIKGDVIPVNGGTHAMILVRATEISKILEQKLKK